MGSLLHLWCNIPRKAIENQPAPDKRRFGLGYQVPPPSRLFGVRRYTAPCTTQGTAPSKLRSQLFWLLWRCSARFTDGRRNHEKLQSCTSDPLETTGHIPGCKPLAQVLPLFRFFLSIAEFSKKTSEDRMAEDGFVAHYRGLNHY